MTKIKYLKGALLLLFFMLSLHSTAQNQADDIVILKQELDSLKSVLDSLKAEGKNSPFKVSVGTSFDFFSGNSTTDLYYDVSFFVPSIWDTTTNKNGKKTTKTFKNRLGLDFAFYQTRVSGDTTRPNLNIESPIEDISNLPSDSVIQVTRRTYAIERTQVNENIGLYISPTYEITENFYGLLHWEGIYRRRRVNLNTTLSTLDTIDMLVSELPERIPFGPDEGVSSYEQSPSFRAYVGVGFLLDMTISSVNFRLKPVIGKAWYNEGLGSRMQNDQGLFYLLNVRLIENNSGIKLGGEIRKLPSGEDGSADIVIYLSKQFSIDKLAEFISSK